MSYRTPGEFFKKERFEDYGKVCDITRLENVRIHLSRIRYLYLEGRLGCMYKDPKNSELGQKLYSQELVINNLIDMYRGPFKRHKKDIPDNIWIDYIYSIYKTELDSIYSKLQPEINKFKSILFEINSLYRGYSPNYNEDSFAYKIRVILQKLSSIQDKMDYTDTDECIVTRRYIESAIVKGTDMLKHFRSQTHKDFEFFINSNNLLIDMLEKDEKNG